MHTDILSKKYYFIYTALIFLSLGLMTSPTIVAGFQIFLIVPAFLILYQASNRKLSKSSLMLIALGSWGILSALYNWNSLNNLGKSFRELTYYFYGVLFIFPLAYFFEAKIKKHWKLLFNILVITIVLAFFVGVSKAWLKFDLVKFKFIEGHNRSGGFSNYMRYGYSSALLAILGLGMFFNREKLKEFINPKYLLTAIVFCVAAIGTSQTRGALLGLLVGSSLLLYRFHSYFFKILLVIGGLFLFVVAYFSFISSEKLDLRFFNVNDGSNSVRVSQWYTAIKVAQDNPILGVGPNQFSYNVTEYKKKYDIWGQHYAAHAHNIVLEHVASYGFVGLVFFLLFFFFWLVEMVSMKNDFGWVIVSYIVAFFVSGQVELLFDVINTNLLFFVYSYSQYIYSKSSVR